MDHPLRLAVLSDLHCHATADYPDGTCQSLLQGDAPRVPPGQHPVQALLDAAELHEFEADVLICAGDLAHKASVSGLHSSVSYLGEISKALGCRATITTIGNHDVQSRKGGDPFRTLKTLRPHFPCSDLRSANEYWNQGFYVQRVDDRLDVIVVNTAHHHFTEPEARHGTVPEATLDLLDRHLRETATDRMPRLAMLHHHPILHTVAGFESSDVIPNGDRLLECLARNGCRFVIHGHKHCARLQRVTPLGEPAFIFAAGSFSAHLDEVGTYTTNLFHLLTFSDLWAPEGEIRTWEYNYSQGWNPTTMDGSGFPFHVGFGAPPPSNYPIEVVAYVESVSDRYVTRSELDSRFPYLTQLVPDEVRHLSRALQERGCEIFHSDNEFFAAVARGRRSEAT